MQEEEGLRGKGDIHDLSLEDMELEIDIDKVFSNVDQLENTAHHVTRKISLWLGVNHNRRK
jgi:hypothetical protein